MMARLTKRLQDDLGLAEDGARWAVESWALALGVLSPADLRPHPTAPVDMPAASVSRRSSPQSPAHRSIAPGPISPMLAPPSLPPSSDQGTPASPPPAAPAKRGRGWLVGVVVAAVLAVGLILVLNGRNTSGSSPGAASPVSSANPTPVPCYTGSVPPPPVLGPNAGLGANPCPTP